MGLHCFGFGIVRTKGFFGDMVRLVVISPPHPHTPVVESANFTGTVNTPLAPTTTTTTSTTTPTTPTPTATATATATTANYHYH